LLFALSPVFASARTFVFFNHPSFQRITGILTGQPIAAANVAVATAETPGVKADWSKDEDRVDASLSKGKLAKMKGVTNALVDFLRDSCLGAGAYSPTWHGEYYSGKNSPGTQLKFGVTCHFAEQNADLSITANDLQPLLDQVVVNGQHFMSMRIANSSEKNVFFYTDVVGNDASAGQTKMWLVTIANGQIPFTPVTRKEYLTE